MHRSLVPLFSLILVSCAGAGEKDERDFSTDSTELVAMVRARESAMQQRDLEAVMKPFDSVATFINGGGYYYRGLPEIRAFHESMLRNDSLTYTYKAGRITLESIRPRVAILYYPWKQDWSLNAPGSDTLHETGLMTIVAVMKGGRWRWRAVTNQRTKEYFEDLTTHRAPAMR